jgi:hypothetical protein
MLWDPSFKSSINPQSPEDIGRRYLNDAREGKIGAPENENQMSRIIHILAATNDKPEPSLTAGTSERQHKLYCRVCSSRKSDERQRAFAMTMPWFGQYDIGGDTNSL